MFPLPKGKQDQARPDATRLSEISASPFDHCAGMHVLYYGWDRSPFTARPTLSD